MAILNAQGKGQSPFNYYSLDASNNGFIEGLEGLYSRSALLLHANTAQRERGDGGQQGGHGSRWGGRRQPGTGDEVGHLLSMGCRLCQNTKQMTFTKTRGVYVNRQASCVIYVIGHGICAIGLGICVNSHPRSKPPPSLYTP